MTTTLSPHTLETADLAAILRTYNDVTERLKHSHDALAQEVCRLREKLHQQDKELQRRERLASLGQMAAGVAHEIRNPLGGIGLYASLLDRDLVDRPAERDIVRKLSAGIRNVESIVSDILAFAGDGEPNSRCVCLARVLEDTLAQTDPKAQALRVQVAVDPALLEVELFCDGAQIERALINLILNAVDAAGANGQVYLRLHLAGGNDGLVGVAVEDNGPGVESEHQHRVFDPFFTTKDTGTGLGLAIVHRIAESNGGYVRVENRTGGGARFVLFVPRHRQDRPE